MFVDVGVYGVPKNERFDAERTTRKVEEFVRYILYIIFTLIFVR